MFSRTYAVEIPWWWVRAIAANYESSARLELGMLQKQIRYQKVDGKMKSFLAVPIQLRKQAE